MLSNKLTIAASLTLLSTLAAAAPTTRDTSTAQIQCTASFLGAGEGGAGLLLVGSGANSSTANQGNGDYTLVGRDSSDSTAPLVVNPKTIDTFRFYECSSNSLGVQSREYDDKTGFSNYYGLIVLQHGTDDDGLLAGKGQCIQTSTAPPEEDHSSANFVVAPCSLDDTGYIQAKQFFRFPSVATNLYFRGNTQFPNFLDGHGLQTGDQVSAQQGTSQNQYNGFQFVDTD